MDGGKVSGVRGPVCGIDVEGVHPDMLTVPLRGTTCTRGSAKSAANAHPAELLSGSHRSGTHHLLHLFHPSFMKTQQEPPIDE